MVMVFQSLSRVQLLQPCGLQPARLLCPWDSPGKKTGVDCHFLLQGIFLIWASNPGLLHCRQILYRLSYKGSPLDSRCGDSYVSRKYRDRVLSSIRAQNGKVIHPSIHEGLHLLKVIQICLHIFFGIQVPPEGATYKSNFQCSILGLRQSALPGCYPSPALSLVVVSLNQSKVLRPQKSSMYVLRRAPRDHLITPF